MKTSVNPVTEIEPATDTETNSETSPESHPEIRVLKTASCPSRSGKSQLSYSLGHDSTGRIQFQVNGNDGGGYFNADWVPQSSIQAVLDKLPKGKGITSATFRPIYASKSTNSPGFLAGVLLHCGLLQPSTDKARCYELRDPKAFIEGVNALLESAPGTGTAVMPDAPVERKTLTLKVSSNIWDFLRRAHFSRSKSPSPWRRITNRGLR